MVSKRRSRERWRTLTKQCGVPFLIYSRSLERPSTVPGPSSGRGETVALPSGTMAGSRNGSGLSGAWSRASSLPRGARSPRAGLAEEGYALRAARPSQGLAEQHVFPVVSRFHRNLFADPERGVLGRISSSQVQCATTRQKVGRVGRGHTKDCGSLVSVTENVVCQFGALSEALCWVSCTS